MPRVWSIFAGKQEQGFATIDTTVSTLRPWQFFRGQSAAACLFDCRFEHRQCCAIGVQSRAESDGQRELARHVPVLKSFNGWRFHPRQYFVDNLRELQMRLGGVARLAVGEKTEHKAVDLVENPGVAKLREHPVNAMKILADFLQHEDFATGVGAELRAEA